MRLEHLKSAWISQLVPFGTRQALRVAWRLVTLLSGAPFFVLIVGRITSVVISVSGRSRNPHGHIFFRLATYTILAVFPSSFAYFMTQVHILFCHPHNLRCLLKASSCRYSTFIYVYKVIRDGKVRNRNQQQIRISSKLKTNSDWLKGIQMKNKTVDAG